MKGKNKIVVYGGTFDPPHKGHFALIKGALATLRPERLYIVPGFRSPFKDPPCAPFGERVALLRGGLAAAGLAGDPRVRIHPLEKDRGRLTYTWETAAFFKKAHPGAELFFLMGSDCLATFPRWKNYRRILASARLAVGARAGFPLEDPRGLPFTRLKGRFPLIASKRLKMELFAGFEPPGLFKSTAARIRRRGLYLGRLRRAAFRLMTPARARHTGAVTLLAQELAAKYGADPEKTALAALLHDAARDLAPRALAGWARLDRAPGRYFGETLRRAPVLLHAAAGAGLAAKKFGVTDRAVLGAIRSHTLGSRSPGALDKILYVADLAADGRDFPEARRVRELAFLDLDAAYAAANYVKLSHAFRTGGWLHPESAGTWNSLLEKRD